MRVLSQLRVPLWAVMTWVMLFALVITMVVQNRRLNQQIQQLDETVKLLDSNLLDINDELAVLHSLPNLRERIGALEGLRIFPLARFQPRGRAPEFRGVFRQLFMTQSGEAMSPSGHKRVVLWYLDRDEMWNEVDGKIVSRIKINVNMSANPIEFDAIFLDGHEGSSPRRGIATIDDEMLTFCMGPAGGGRPQRFSTSTGDGSIMVVARREQWK